MYNQHTRGMATTRHRRLVRRGGRKAFVRDKGIHTKKMSGKTDIHESSKQKRFEHIELPKKANKLFLT